jgi:lysophospholipase L1-like esterase
MLKRIGFWLFYISILLVTALVGVEILVRVFSIAPPYSDQMGWLTEDQYLPYKPIPHSRRAGWDEAGGYRYDDRYNSLGFRDDEHSIEKPSDVFRILGVGDSFTEGWGADYEDTYLRRLEVALNSRAGDHPKIEIIKAGINGYFPETERLVIQHYGLQFDPDLIVIGFVPNDLLDTHRGVEAIRVDKTGYLTTAEAASLGTIAVSIYRRWHSSRIVLRTYARRQIENLPEDWWMNMYRQTKDFETAWKEIFHQYDGILSLARKSGADLAVVHIPNFKPRQRFHDFPAQQIGEWCQSNNVVFIDTLPEIRRMARSMRLYWKDNHLRPEGYSVVANVLQKQLEERRLVP